MNNFDQTRGYAWHNGILHDPLPPDLFPRDCSPEQFFALLQALDGNFSCVLDRGDHILAAVDRIRSYPLFFAVRDNEILLGPDAYELRDRLGSPPLDHSVLPEFLLAGFITGNDTLIPLLKQLEAGQCLIWNKITATLEIKDYFLYQHDFEPGESSLEDLDRVHGRVFQRLIASAAGRTIVIPLSGGNDSRLVAVMLKRLGYGKVICFTYGSSHSRECQTSRRVAKFLNFPWIMVEQNRRLWYEAFHSDAMRRHFGIATHLSVSPHIQDWLAVRTLHERGQIPGDSLFTPGHSGDFPEGANLSQIFADKEELTRRDLLDVIFDRFYDLWPCSRERRHELFGPRLTSLLQIPETIQSEIAASLFDEFDWRNREAKFIVNSVRVYEFFGYGWRVPLWDREFLDFWRHIPVAQRVGQSLYRQYKHRYQASLPISANDLSLGQRLDRKLCLARFGNLGDHSYGRFLDYRDRAAYLNTPVSTLLEPGFPYPGFVQPKLPILQGHVNGIQALIYLRMLLKGDI